MVKPLGIPAGDYARPRISPDGQRIAFEVSDGKESNIWIYELSGATAMRRLTFGGNNRYPIWTADGRRIAFQSDREGDLAIFWQLLDGNRTAERLTKPDPGTSHQPNSWSPKDPAFSFTIFKGKAAVAVFSLQDNKPAIFVDVPISNQDESAFSPDGRWIAYRSSETNLNNIFVKPFPDTGAKYQISSEGGLLPLWSPDGKELFYRSRKGQLVSVRVTTQPGFTTGNPTPLAIEANGPNLYDITPDGKYFLFVNADQTQAEDPHPSQIQVVLNWIEDLKQKLPVK
jgi:serine/threonine-protein kinase